MSQTPTAESTADPEPTPAPQVGDTVTVEVETRLPVGSASPASMGA